MHNVQLPTPISWKENFWMVNGLQLGFFLIVGAFILWLVSDTGFIPDTFRGFQDTFHKVQQMDAQKKAIIILAFVPVPLMIVIMVLIAWQIRKRRIYKMRGKVKKTLMPNELGVVVFEEPGMFGIKQEYEARAIDNSEVAIGTMIELISAKGMVCYVKRIG